MKFYNFLISFDLLSPGPELTHKGNSRYTNMVGLLFTLATIGITLFIKDIFLDFLFNENPTVTVTDSYTIGNNFTINQSSVKFFFQFQNFDIDTGVMKFINMSELRSKFPPDAGFPILSNLKISKQGYEYENITIPLWQYNITYVTQLAGLHQCNRSFFDDYNSHLDYGKDGYTNQQISELVDTSMCLPDFISDEIHTTEEESKVIAIIFLTEMVKYLNQAGYPFLFVTFNYQKMVINTESQNYDDYYRKIWKRRNFYLDPLYREVQLAKIQNTTINTDRKKIIIPQGSEHYNFTFENFEQWYKIPVNGGIRDSSLTLFLQMDTYKRRYEIKYTSFDDILDRYGGTSSVFFYVFELIMGYIISPFYTSSLVNEVFKFHENVMDEIEIKDFKTNFKNVFREKDNLEYVSKTNKSKLFS